MNITFPNHYGTMPLEKSICSIFDYDQAGQIDTNGDYYCIMGDHKTKEMYAMSVEDRFKADELGRTLEVDEYAIFNGEFVRGRTYSEELYESEGRLSANVDIWGNIQCESERR